MFSVSYNLYLELERCQTRGHHILQRKIQLATIDNHPFDLRVMVQREINSSLWQVTGKIAGVAAKEFCITNAIKEVLSVEKAIEASILAKVLQQDIAVKIDRLALLTAVYLEEYYRKFYSMAIDRGIDNGGEVWIIEVNLDPNISLLSRLEDGSMYERMKDKKI
ncbi:YheC/YheD family protein [Natronincola ferrireducens]|uniref:Uncharacterized protein n=1 Tax=Natronincola ferrireducens TaxID=393762 RepID=A0A1G9E9E0_9FIRM|nr:YheC/YheD family protein [Natronincola ferrireducens]SDK72769.1 hypothetical protein SAMN05660472_01881 [Natronincola ferrireducens]